VKKNIFNLFNFIGHVAISFLLCKWWLIEKEFNYEAAIGLISYLFIIIAYLQSQIIIYPYFKFYTETHEDGENKFFTLVAIWSHSTERITNEDFLKNRLPTLFLLPGYGKIEKMETVPDFRNQKKFSYQNKSDGEYLLNMEYWDNRDYIILKFYHTEAPYLGTIRTAPDEYQRLYKINAHMDGRGRSKNSKFESIEPDEFWGTRYFPSIYFLIFISTAIFLFSVLGDSFLQFTIILILSSVVITIILLVLILIFTPRRLLHIRESFTNLGGEHYIEYTETN